MAIDLGGHGGDGIGCLTELPADDQAVVGMSCVQMCQRSGAADRGIFQFLGSVGLEHGGVAMQSS
ncbi:hypothetical protein FrCorBMG51_23865 [Protofrankia coriariae]|uniref:Uncharacterized protein n=1 Tax=Protofrankia coriariae TaxID=1562887 RepID=A0ABR5EYN4_9ACTN|nr:hypothetical protein FrCorBMG51_23865 [Protofrankia coriariae]